MFGKSFFTCIFKRPGCRYRGDHLQADPVFHENQDIAIFAYGEASLDKIKEIDIGLVLGFDDLKSRYSMKPNSALAAVKLCSARSNLNIA
jgi:hypothetical protein